MSKRSFRHRRRLLALRDRGEARHLGVGHRAEEAHGGAIPEMPGQLGRPEDRRRLWVVHILPGCGDDGSRADAARVVVVTRARLEDVVPLIEERALLGEDRFEDGQIDFRRVGLDLPEVSLVAILDADKEGFLRSERSLIQTIGRAARNLRGKAILYADRITDSMRRALDETERLLRARFPGAGFRRYTGSVGWLMRHLTAEDADRMRRETGCAGVMIARGSFGQPWIFTQARALFEGQPVPATPPVRQRFAIALDHARMVESYEQDLVGAALEFRKHLGWYVRGLPHSADLRRRLHQVSSFGEVEGIFGDYLAAAERGGADLIHVDVMDGHFVPNITIGVPVVRALKRVATRPLDVHLMIEYPDRYLEAFVEAGASYLSVHLEAVPHLHRTIQEIKRHGKKAGVVLNPATPPQVIDHVIGDVDLILVMSVNPGFGGQSFLPYTLKKVERLARVRKERGLHFPIEIDGGVGPGNRAVLVLVRGVAADADRTDDFTILQHEHAARHWNETPFGRRSDRALKRRAILQAIADGAARNAHAERAPRLADRDVDAAAPRIVHPRER